MNEIKVLIVEDEILVAEDIASYLKEYGFRVTGIATSNEECFTLIEADSPDIILMDINIQGKLDGIEVAKILNHTRKIPFIFLTANSDQTTLNRALPLQPDAFITKPFNKKDLKIAIELACQKHNTTVFETSAGEKMISQCVFVKEGTQYKRIEIPSILFIEANGSYSTIHTTSKPYTLSYNLNYFSNQVNNPVFRRVHRSFIINVNKVEGFDHNSLMINKTSIPIGKQFHKEVMALFTKL